MLNSARSFPQHTRSFNCTGDNCNWRGRPVLLERVASHDDSDLPDPRDPFPEVQVVRVERHIDDDVLTHSR